MTAFLKHVFLIVLAVLGISTLLSAGSLWALRQSHFYKPSFVANIISEKEFDYVVLGASTGLTTLNTQRIDSICNSKGINLSMDDTSLPSQYLMLQHFLAEGNTTKFCILAPSVHSFDLKQHRLSDNDYRFLPYVNRSYVYEYYTHFSGSNATILAWSKRLPLLGVAYYNAEVFYPSLLSLTNANKRNRFDAHGNYEYPFVKFKDSALTDFKPMPVAFKNNYLKKIKALCDSQNIQLICYISPMMDKQVISASSSYTHINHSGLLKNARNFNDAIHVNYLGNRLASMQFAKDLQPYLNANEAIDD